MKVALVLGNKVELYAPDEHGQQSFWTIYFMLQSA